MDRATVARLLSELEDEVENHPEHAGANAGNCPQCALRALVRMAGLLLNTVIDWDEEGS